MNIVVLAGGYSPERDVSLTSGSLIANALIKTGHKVLLLDLYEGLDLCVYDDAQSQCEKLFRDDKTYSYKIQEIEPDLEELKRSNNNGDSFVGKNVLEICMHADIVFIALHGGMGENGQIQAMFDSFGIKYTGTGYAGSLLAMDKYLTKKMFLNTNITTADFIYLDVNNDNIEEKIEKIKLPCVVKPCNCGSSVGVSIVKSEKELEEAIALAQKYESQILIEEYIQGREFSVGILDGKYLPPIEIIPKEGFFDYKNKYQAGLTEEICPAKLTEQETEVIGRLAEETHRTLGLKDYSRIDFIYDGKEFHCLEANTLPGMAQTSLLPQEAAAAGITYEELCNKIVELGLI